MKPLEILLSLPEWANATHEKILASPAWTLPCRLGTTQCTMRLGADHPAETLNLKIRLENEDHVLGIANSPAFPDLSAVWNSRADVPEPILLALVEKDCGSLLQLLENAVHKQLQVVGLAEEPPAPDAQTMFAQVSMPDDAPPIVFSLDLSQSILATLGLLRNIDPSHPSVRETTLPTETEYASFALSAADSASLATGDALLLPEAESLPPRVIVAGRLALTETGVEKWKEEDILRVCAAEGSTISLGTLFDSESGGAAALPPPPRENAPLRLVRLGKTIATGRFGPLASQRAMFID